MSDYFLTGATGSLGLSFVRILLESSPEARVYCLVRNPERSPLASEALGRLFPDERARLDAQSRIQLVKGDVTEPGLGIEQPVWDHLVGRIGRVVHMAASVDFLSSLDEARALNVTGTRNVIDFARACLKRDAPDFRVCHVSTAYVCGKGRGLLREDALDPNAEFWNHYERTKAESEKLLRDSVSELPITIVRPSQIIGDAQSGEVHKYFGFYEFVGLAVRGRSNVLVADREARPDMIPVDYVARGMLHLMQRPDAVGRTYHLAAGLQASLPVASVVDLVLELMSDMPELKARVGLPRVLRADELDAQLSPAERKAFEFSPQKLLLRSYAPYLDYERDFDVAATQSLLAAAGVALPDMAETIRRTTRYALAQRHRQALPAG
ncbi:SDR family oxidoreductase [Aquabacterium sp. A7-Y]|uniref:SDR family oxidoreductase n=1 Tax=Aquabacterium sp. A7-Y TaxID=1349605 RepID=UPI00223E4239|nr:SDR family oxidoreductase [Aquabacterium sp. A7-Y]MCW7540416.1 SDR family oxidoreductase [Aquabacterium sp. A7-Y]